MLNQLRKFLLESIAELKTHPDKLQIWIDAGKVNLIVGSLCHNIDYTINILVTDYSNRPESLTVPIIAFINKNTDSDADPQLTFETEIIDHDRADVLYTFKHTQKVVVTDNNGELIIAPTCVSTEPWWVDPAGEYHLISEGKEVATWQI